MNQTSNSPEAIAEISFEKAWNLPHAGTAQFRYWSHVHFESDPKGKEELWTLFVELDKPPEQQKQNYLAKIFFLSPNGPNHFLRPGQKFELSIGPMIKAHGVVKEICAHS